MKLAYISDSFQLWPLYAAGAKDFFSREGIDVESTLTRSSSRQLEALVRGDYDIGLQQSDHVVRAVEQGADLFIFMAAAPQPDLTMVVAPGIRDIGELRGRTVAVDGARSGYALLQRKLMADRALAPGAYTVVEAGGVRERYDALRSGAAVAAWLNPPFDGWLLAQGYGSLGTVSDLFPGYPGSIAAARRSWAQADPGRLIAFIRAYDAAHAWIVEPRNRGDAEAIAMARLGTDREQMARAYESFAASTRPAIGPEGLRAVIDVVWAAENYPAPPGSPERYLDLGYLVQARQR